MTATEVKGTLGEPDEIRERPTLGSAVFRGTMWCHGVRKSGLFPTLGTRVSLNEIAETDTAERFINGSVIPDSDLELPGPYSEYLDWQVGREITPATRAAEYLGKFELANVHGAESAPMGSIVFLEGPRLGNTRSICALADGLEAVSGLQRRLLELGESIPSEDCPFRGGLCPFGSMSGFRLASASLGTVQPF